MFIRYKHVMDGPGPSEAIVEVETVDGSEEIIVDKTILKNGTMDVGDAITNRDHAYLLELPRETTTGRMRVWVHEGNVEIQKTFVDA